MRNVPFNELPLKKNKYDRPSTIPGTVLVIIEARSKLFLPFNGVLALRRADINVMITPKTAVKTATISELT